MNLMLICERRWWFSIYHGKNENAHILNNIRKYCNQQVPDESTTEFDLEISETIRRSEECFKDVHLSTHLAYISAYCKAIEEAKIILKEAKVNSAVNIKRDVERKLSSTPCNVGTKLQKK